MLKKRKKFLIIILMAVSISVTVLYALERYAVSKINNKIAQIATRENFEQINKFVNDFKAEIKIPDITSEPQTTESSQVQTTKSAQTSEEAEEPTTKATSVNNSGKNVSNIKTPPTVDDISAEDKVKGVELASKLDISYLLDVSKDGFTPSAKRKIKEHFKSNLSDSEIKQLLELYDKYSYLLDEY